MPFKQKVAKRMMDPQYGKKRIKVCIRDDGSTIWKKRIKVCIRDDGSTIWKKRIKVCIREKGFTNIFQTFDLKLLKNLLLTISFSFIMLSRSLLSKFQTGLCN